METITGFIYYLQNPTTDEIFYVGATEFSIKYRLKVHYCHLREVIRGLRRTNARYDYLKSLLPIKATIHLLEIVTTKQELRDREIFYIKQFRNINPKLTNMTDGGRGGSTSKYFTEQQMEAHAIRISKSTKGKPKPKGFSEKLSLLRMGKLNPAARELKEWIVCFVNDTPKRLFKYGFEINQYVGSKHAFSNVYKSLKTNKKSYEFRWEYYKSCSKEVQDIVRIDYESRQ